MSTATDEKPAKAKKSPRDLGARCSATTRSGEPCTNPAMTGLTICHVHGGAQRTAIVKSETARTTKEVADWARPIAKDDPRASPINALLEEQRWTLGRIDYLRSRIGELEGKSLVWEKASVEVETIGASETPGKNRRVRYETRINTLVELEQRERKHLVELSRLMLNAGFENARLQIAAGMKGNLTEILFRTVENLGFARNDEDAKAAIRGALRSAQEFRVPSLDAAT